MCLLVQQLVMYFYVASVTQVAKQQWPFWAADIGLTPDNNPAVFASLTPDELRAISLICPFLKVVILPGRQFGEVGVIHFPFPVPEIHP